MCQYYCMVAPYLTLKKCLIKKAWWELHKDAVCYFERILEEAPYKTGDKQPLTSQLTNHPSKTNCRAISALKRLKYLTYFTDINIYFLRIVFICILCEMFVSFLLWDKFIRVNFFMSYSPWPLLMYIYIYFLFFSNLISTSFTFGV